MQGLLRAGSTFISFKINVFELLGNLSITSCFLVPLLALLSQAAGSPAINASIRTDFFKIKRLLSGQHFRSQISSKIVLLPWVGNFSTNPLEIVPGLCMTRSEDYQGCVLLICSLMILDYFRSYTFYLDTSALFSLLS